MRAIGSLGRVLTVCFLLHITAWAVPEEILAKIDPKTYNDKTLFDLLDTISHHNKDIDHDLVIEIQDGTTHIGFPIYLNAAHSGSNGHYVIFRAAKGTHPVISNGTRVTDWRQDEKGRWRVSFHAQTARQLFVNGKRARKARGPFPTNAERYGNIKALDADTGFLVPGTAMAQWKNPADIVLGFFNSWSHMTCNIDSITAETDGRSKLHMHRPTFMLISRKEGAPAEMPSYIENAFAVLDEPGEWYADSSDNVLYYVPRLGEEIVSSECIVTERSNLLEIGPEASDGPAHHIRFEGITFADASAIDMDERGHADVQANFTIEPYNVYERKGALVNVHNEHKRMEASVRICSANSIVFENCKFTRMGGAALNIGKNDWMPGDSASDITIRNCEFSDIGASAIQIGDVGRSSHHPSSDKYVVRNNRIENCKIHDCGVEFEDSVGIFAGYTQGTVIERNEIYNMPYSGISIGWGWGEEDAGGSTYPVPYIYETPTPARDNRIANNHIHNVMLKRQDGGGIYTLGNQPGTVIEGNHIHDNPGIPGGIYLDEGSGFIEVRNNRVYNVPTPMNFNNKNQNRIATCNVHDNDFAETKK